jgi:MFS transporter, DHA2 family, multidrug resistance protein
MGTLSNQEMGNASGLFNLMRNTGGSIGIAVVTTLLSRGAQVHQAAMVSHLTPYDPAFQQRVQQLSGPAASLQQAYGTIYGIVARQAMVMSFLDNFRLLAGLSLLCIPAVFLFKKVRALRGAVAPH